MSSTKEEYLKKLYQFRNAKSSQSSLNDDRHKYTQKHINELKKNLGAGTWTFLHTTAATYPQNPTNEQKQHASNLIHAIAELYACKWCREDFKKRITINPPRLNNREEFSLWLCEEHNVVNEKLGKPIFNCDKVWERYGGKKLDDNDDEGLFFIYINNIKDCELCVDVLGKDAYKKMKDALQSFKK